VDLSRFLNANHQRKKCAGTKREIIARKAMKRRLRQAGIS
jgi:hypothetical protein